MSCPIGQVRDVSRDGFRLRCEKKPRLRVGEVHEVVLRAGGKQVRVASRVQWVRRVGIWPPAYEAGFAIIDARAGVGEAVLQFGQFGCVSDRAAPSASRADPKPKPPPPPPWEGQPTSQGQTPGDEDAAQRSYEIPDEDLSASVEIEDLYELLEVPPDADSEAIKASYRRLARQHHPDHNTSPDADAMFARLSSAYAVLRDDQRRKWYDEMRRGGGAAA